MYVIDYIQDRGIRTLISSSSPDYVKSSVSIKQGLWTTDCGLGIKYGLGIKRGLENMDWV